MPRNAAGRPRRQPIFEARDLYRVPLWFLQKPLYAFAPISLHFRLASLRGTVDSASRDARTSLVETLETHLGETTSRRELQRIARRHLRATRKGQFTMIWPQVRNFAGVEAIEIHGLEHLDEALARGKGAILVSAHFGFARMIKPVLRSRGRRVLVVGPDEAAATAGREPRLTQIGRFVRTRLLHLPGTALADTQTRELIGTDLPLSFNLHPHVEALERNETLVLLADGPSAQAHQTVEVVGIKLVLASGAVSIARSTGAAVLPAFVVDEPGRAGPAGLRLVIHPPLVLQATDDRRADAEVNVRRFADVYEEQIRAHPHNVAWHWVRDGAFESRRSRRQRGASLSLYGEAYVQPDRHVRRDRRKRPSS